MRVSSFNLAIAAVMLVAGPTSASAAPPASCAAKFVGTWAFAGGVTTVSPNGQAYPKCPACVSVQTWTCSGDTYLFSNSGAPGEFSARLIDRNHMQGSGGTATRVGGGRGPAETTKTPRNADTVPKAVPSRQAAAEPGLIEGKRFPIVQGPVGRIYAAIDMALAQYSYDKLAQFSQELSELQEFNAKKRALKERIIATLDNIRRLAANQQWGQLQRSVRTYQALKAQYRGMKSEYDE